MSEFFRTHAPPEFVALTTRDLARLCHQAENADDDVLLLQVWDEVERRKREFPRLDTQTLFMEHYRQLWRTEFAPGR